MMNTVRLNVLKVKLYYNKKILLYENTRGKIMIPVYPVLGLSCSVGRGNGTPVLVQLGGGFKPVLVQLGGMGITVLVLGASSPSSARNLAPGSGVPFP